MLGDIRIPDPMTRFDDYLSRAGLGSSPIRPEYRRPMKPDEWQSMSGRLLDYGKTGLGAIFHTLSAPGDYLRGAIGGELGSRMSGRELLDRYGVTSKRDKGWGSWGLGLAADVASDPLTYATFGAKHALTPLGKALSKTGETSNWSRKAMLEGFDATETGLHAAGQSAEEIAHLMRGGLIKGLNEKPWRVATLDQEQLAHDALGRLIKPGERLSGIAGMRLPFTDIGFTVGGGKLGKALAGGMDTAFDTLKYGNRVGRVWNRLFDNDVFGAVDEASQRGYKARGVGQFEKSLEAGRAAQYDAASRLEPLLRAKPDDELKYLDAAQTLGEKAARSRLDPNIVRSTQEALGGTLPDFYRKKYVEARHAGLPLEEWANPNSLNYMRRQALFGERDALRPRYSLYPTMTSVDMHREELFNQAGGSGRLDDWAKRFSGIKGSKKPAAKAMWRDMVRDLNESNAMQGIGKAIPKEQLKAMHEQAGKLAELYAGFTPAHVTQNLPLFNPDVVGNLGDYAYQHGRKMASAHGAYGALAHLAKPTTEFAGEQYISMPEVLRRMGFGTYLPNSKHGLNVIHGAMPELLKALAPKGGAMVEPLLRDTTLKNLTREVGRFGIPADKLPDLMKSYAQWQSSEALKGPLKFWDSASNLFKALAYPIWPASHAKNAVTAAINNMRTGTRLGDYVGQLGLMRNPSITDPVVNAARREQFSAAKIFGGFDSSSELAGMDTPTRIRQGGRVTMNLPGSDRAGPTGTLLGDIAHLGVKEGAIDTLANIGKAAGSIAMKPWSPTRWKEAISQNLGVKGVAGQLVDNLPAVHAGRIASMNVEDFFRGAQFKGLIRQGYTPEQASKVINRLHFDYGNLTEFEKGAMRRIFPFYTFMSRNIPLQAETLMTRPGIALSQLYPAQQERHKNPYVPDYLAGNVSVPLGETEPGKGRFIGTFGLPIEEAFSKFNLKGGAPDVRGTILGFMGNANPLIKGPMESLFNTQFYSGRKLSDLKAGSTARAIGGLFGDENPQMLAQALANTPFTRFVTSLDRATDARKPLWAKLLNLGTGVRVTDVDLDTQRAIEARDALSDMLGRQPHLSSYTNWFVKPEMQARMTPAEVELMRGLVSMQRRAKDYVDNRRRPGIEIAR